MIFSNTARTVEGRKRHAKTKNQAAHRRPSAMWLKIFGSVTKIRFDRCPVPAEGKARREDDQTGSKCYERIQNRNIDGLAEQRTALADIAAEDSHRADAERQRENA